MIIVEGWIKFGSGEADKIVDAGKVMMEKTAAEDGCIHYAFARDIADPDIIRISEKWESMEALQAHGKAPHMADFNAVVGTTVREGADVRAYESSELVKLI